jgi:hypothetical protein
VLADGKTDLPAMNSPGIAEDHHDMELAGQRPIHRDQHSGAILKIAREASVRS